MRSEPQVEPPVEFQRIAPTVRSRDAETPASRGASTGATPGVSARTILFGLVALLILGALAFWLLPGLLAPAVNQPTAPASAEPNDPAAKETLPKPAPAAPLNFDDPELLRTRAAAQEARTQYEQQSVLLAAAGVERWAPAQQAEARKQAEAGAAAFASKDFAQAQKSFEAATAITSQGVAEIPQRMAAALDAGNQALAASDKPAAKTAFELALVIEPGNTKAQRGLERVDRFDDVRAKLDTASRLEQIGDIAGARAAWNQALALDSDTQSARDALGRLDAQAADAEFRRVLGEAIAALDRGQLDVADSRLGRARALRGGDAAVQQAGARLAEARKSVRLAGLNRDASAQVQAEDWAGAVATYKAAQQVDSSVAFATDGLAQAEPRAALASAMQNLIDRPARLSSAAVAGEARQLLAEARSAAPSGPRLQAHIATLDRLLAQTATPVAVELVSDQKTEVTIYKVGDLGRFATHSARLKPGRYIAVGTRTGFVDVRKEFEVPPGSGTIRLDIRCEEAL
ncbi:MAG: hypothetical protein ACT4PZ_21825 [Panacagrimonas sp.]